MSIRKDYTSKRMTINRPTDEIYKYAKKSPYKKGNERMTNPSVLSLVTKNGMLQRLQDSEECVKGWSIRVFESSHPIVSTDTDNMYAERPHYSEPRYGHHQIVVISPNKEDDMSTLSVDQWSNILVVIQDRLRWLYTQKGVGYVAIYADHGKKSASIESHPHINVVTFSNIPPAIDDEITSHHKIQNEDGICPMCKMVEDEMEGPRQILKTEGHVALTPWAPLYPYEFWIMPKKHITSFGRITQKDINDLALIMRATLGGVHRISRDISYSMAFHLSPERKNSMHIHWNIRVYPITKAFSGLELGYGMIVNDKDPEEAAEELGAHCRKELAALVGIE